MAALTISAPASVGSRRGTSVSRGTLVPAAVPATVVRRSASASNSAPLRLTLRGRRLLRTAVIAVALLVALVGAVLGGVSASQAGNGAAVSGTATVVVQPGQTLWAVARSVAPAADVRETVARIKSLNGLSGAAGDTVHPGQALVVPAVG